MLKSAYIATAIISASMFGSVAGAQVRGGGVSVRMPVSRFAPEARTSISTAIPRATRPAIYVRMSRTGQLLPATSGFTNSIDLTSTNGVPGLGFDYSHLAAINGGLHSSGSGTSARGNHRRGAAITPILIGGFPYYPYAGGDYLYDSSYDSSGYAQPQEQAQQPQVIVVQQPVAIAPQDSGSGNDTAAPATISAAPAAPVRDVGDFILVRRDGRVLFASAFSVAAGQLRYVTPEGIRRSLPMADLDADATQQMNEARGTTVELYNQ